MRRSLIREGIGVGLAGAVAVAAWFLLYDLAAGRMVGHFAIEERN